MSTVDSSGDDDEGDGMGGQSWVVFLAALLVALAVPGPDLVLVVQSTTRGVRDGASTAAGVVTAVSLHALLAAAGVTALLVSVDGVLTGVKLLGAVILLWMGIGMLRAARGMPPEGDESGAGGQGGGYVRGFITNATNPKAVVFFSAIMPQFIGQGEGAELRTVMLCATVVIGAGLWWAATIAVVRLFGFHRSQSADRIVTVLGGTVLVIIGAGLLAVTVIGLIWPGP